MMKSKAVASLKQTLDQLSLGLFSGRPPHSQDNVSPAPASPVAADPEEQSLASHIDDFCDCVDA